MENRSPARETEIIREIRHGHVNGFAELVGWYWPRVHVLIRRMVRSPETTDDLCQETFFKAFRGLAQFDTTRPLAPWLYRIAVNTVREHFRKSGREIQLIGSEEVTFEGSWNGGFAQVDEGLFLETLLDTMSLGDRILLLLRHGLQLSYEEMAQILDEPVGSVKGTLFRARTALKDAHERAFPPAARTAGDKGQEPV